MVCGHTHRQFDRRVNGWRVINAGSVGMPYEGTVGAYWALLGPTVELHRTEYDLDEGLKELRAGGLPDVDEMLRESLLEPMKAKPRAATDCPPADPTHQAAICPARHSSPADEVTTRGRSLGLRRH